MTLIDSLENATDEEIVEASNGLAGRILKKFLLGVVVSVAIHFVSEFLVGAIEKKVNHEVTN